MRNQEIFAGQPAWRQEGREYVRYLVRHRDGFRCYDCNKKHEPGTRQFDVHHLKGLCGKNSTGYDRLEDMGILITLCRKCHHNRHDWNGNHNRRDRLRGEDKKKRDAKIKRDNARGIPPKLLAKKYKMSKAMVSYILNDQR